MGDLVHTTGSGVHPKWPTPRGVVHTTTSGVHPKWPTPRGVVSTTTSGVHPKWPTTGGPQQLHRVRTSVDSLTILRWVEYFEFIYPEANAHVSLIWLIIHFQQTQSGM